MANTKTEHTSTASGFSLGRPLGALLVLAAVTTAGCGSTLPIGQKPLEFRQHRLENEVRTLGMDPQELIRPYELTPEMRQWVREVVPATGDPEIRLRTLLRALLDPGDQQIEYKTGFTGTAAEAFDSKSANCLAFTHLFVSLAREVGLDAYFLDVAHAETYARNQSLTILSGHVTAGHGLVTNPVVLKYNVGPSVDYHYLLKIEDLRALAMFYSNRGAERLQEGEHLDALDWLRTAVSLDPELGQAWVNYGVVLRRLGELEAAEEAYRQALEVNPRTVSAYQNLATLLRLQGRDREAQELDAVAERRGSRNPYNYVNLGDLSLRSGELEEARRLYRKALNLDRDLPDPYAALGLLAHFQDRSVEARRWLAKARKRDPENSRVRLLERRLNPGNAPKEFVRLETATKKAS